MVKKIFLILLVLCAQSSLLAMSAVPSDADEKAAHFCLLDLEDKQACLDNFKGKPVILFFWTTWCPYCRKELRQLNDMYPEFKNKGFEILAINVGEPAYKVKNFTQSYNLNYRVLLDSDTSVADDYGLVGVPTYIIVDKSGYMRFRGHSFPKDGYEDLPR